MRVLAALFALLCAAPSAHAVISCNLIVNSVAVIYNPVGGDVVTSALYTVTCTRTNTGEGPLVNYSLAADDGLQPQGANRRVAFAGSFYRYDLYKDNSLSSGAQWGTPPPAARAITGTLGFPAGLLTTSTGGTPYYLRVLGGQPVGPAGSYLDTVTAALDYTSNSGSGTAPPVAFMVTVNTFTNCTLALPAALTFNYTSFQAAPAAPTANFTVNCTTGLPYTMTLDGVAQPAPVNVVDDALNLSYSVNLSAGAGTGTGSNQTHQIQGTMTAGQAGTCGGAACTNAAATNKTRTLTVTW